MSYRVIIADASPSVQKAAQMAFPERGFEIYPFEDGNEVLESLGRINPDAVLVSLSLAGKDGYDVGASLRGREEHQKTTLILLKGAFEPLDGERLAGLDCDKIVQKPFDSESLADTVLELVDKKKAPSTLPEEMILEEPPAAGDRPEKESAECSERAEPRGPDREGVKPAADLPGPSGTNETFAAESFSGTPRPGDFEAIIRRSVREEILAVERELEKRLHRTLSAEIKERWEREKSGIPPKE